MNRRSQNHFLPELESSLELSFFFLAGGFEADAGLAAGFLSSSSELESEEEELLSLARFCAEPGATLGVAGFLAGGASSSESLGEGGKQALSKDA